MSTKELAEAIAKLSPGELLIVQELFLFETGKELVIIEKINTFNKN